MDEKKQLTENGDAPTVSDASKPDAKPVAKIIIPPAQYRSPNLNRSPVDDGPPTWKIVMWFVLAYTVLGYAAYKIVMRTSECRNAPRLVGDDSEVTLGGADAILDGEPLDDLDWPGFGAGVSKVPLEAHIMSKCPDARDCLAQLVLPVMERASDKVDFQLSYIGNASELSDEVACKHGPTECVGNMLLLCAANLPAPAAASTAYPKMPVIRSLGFANCMLSDYANVPSRALVQNCALEHGIDFDALNACASRQIDANPPNPDDPSVVSGLALLQQSFRHSQALGVHRSCTVRVDGREWCVRDDGQWKQCDRGGNGSVKTLVGEIERLWEKKN